MRVRELAEWLGATFEGAGDHELTGVRPLESAASGDLSFVGNAKGAPAARNSGAGCLIVPLDFANVPPRTVIRVAQPRTAFARAVSRLVPPRPVEVGIHPSAVVHSTAEIGAGVAIGPHASVGEGSRLGANVRVGGGCTIGRDRTIG